MKTLFYTSIFAVSMALLCAFDTPQNWFIAGSSPKSYDMGIDANAGRNGDNAATIQSKKKNIKGFGTLMQNCSPSRYLGKRVKLSGYLKSEDISGWAGLWFRVDQKGSSQPLGFDNMKNRSIHGTTEWQAYEIVLDVPENATNLAYGALLSGSGKLWFDDLSFEIVDHSIPTTGKKKRASVPLSEPMNLDFEH